jgi:hypothetical protein
MTAHRGGKIKDNVLRDLITNCCRAIRQQASSFEGKRNNIIRNLWMANVCVCAVLWCRVDEKKNKKCRPFTMHEHPLSNKIFDNFLLSHYRSNGGGGGGVDDGNSPVL